MSLSSVSDDPAPRRRRSISRARPGTGRMPKDFARRRGIDTVADVAAEIEEGVSRRLDWLIEKTAQVSKLWERASVALGFAIERQRRVSYSEERTESLSAPIPSVGKYLIPPTTKFFRSVEEDARLAQPSSERWKEREAILRPVLAKIYRDPDGALSTLNALASDAAIEPRKLADDLGKAPDRLGRLRGSDHMVDGRAARDERGVAMVSLHELLPLARAHATEFRRNAARFREREQTRRVHMSLSVPALSKQATARLAEIEAVRKQGGYDAGKSAFAFGRRGSLLVQEVKAVSDALTARFGWSAFTRRPTRLSNATSPKRMPDDFTDERPREADAASSRLSVASLKTASCREEGLRSKIVCRCKCRVREKDKAVLPMLAAVTEFRTPVERGRPTPRFPPRTIVTIALRCRDRQAHLGAIRPRPSTE